MIFIGNNEYPIYLGNTEIPAIYVGDELIYPVNLGNLTGITLDNLTWVTDVPSSGGTATKDNCSYKVVGHYDSGKSRTVTRDATITGSLTVSTENTGDTRIDVGTLVLTATYSGFTASGSVEAYQAVPYQYFRITNLTDTAGNIIMTKNGIATNLILRTRTNGGAWSSDTTYSASTTITLPANGYVEFDGINNPCWSSGTSNYYPMQWGIGADVDIKVSGELMSLVSARTVTQNFEFFRFFQIDSSYRGNVKDVSELILGPDNMTLRTACFMEFCSGLNEIETAPVLPFTSGAAQCYENMFYSCSKLKYIKCLLATNNNCTNSWVTNVQTTSGTFVKNPDATFWIRGINSIPFNWTVVDNVANSIIDDEGHNGEGYWE